MDVGLNKPSPSAARRGIATAIALLLCAACSHSAHADPLKTLGSLRPSSAPAPAGANGPTHSEPLASQTIAEYMSAVFASLNEYWRNAFAKAGVRYRRPESVWVPVGLTTDSNCGRASYPAEAFYCPGGPGAAVHSQDRIYVSLDWVQHEIDQRPLKDSSFLVASVIAHMFSHHVQRSVGLITQPAGLCCQLGPTEVENNADCLAGVWARTTFGREMVDDAAVLDVMTVIIGTRDLEKLAPGAVPETVTAADRSAFFEMGYDTGKAERCQPAVSAASRPRS